MSMPVHAQPSLLRESCLCPISFFSWREDTILFLKILIIAQDSRGALHFAINDYAITITENTILVLRYKWGDVSNRGMLQMGDVMNGKHGQNDSFNTIYILNRTINNIFNNTLPLEKNSKMHLYIFQRYYY